MKNNLILVYPPKSSTGYTSDVSLALLYLAGVARESGLCENISIFDFNTPFGIGKSINDLLETIFSLGYDGKTIVAINCLFSAVFPYVRKIAKSIKETFPDIMVITGGMHPTFFAKEIIDNCPEIDAVALGESDSTFPKLLRFFYKNECINNLEGYCLRLNGKTVIATRSPFIADLDSLPRPGYEFYNFEEYSNDTSNWWDPDGIKISPFYLPILTSRSCPVQCSFCAMRIVMGNIFRSRCAENVFEEIKFLYDVYGVNYFKIEDDNITLHRERFIKLCKLIINSRIKIYFDTQNGISLRTLDEEIVDLMRRAGFIMVSLAIESGSDYIRNKIMGKNISRAQIIRAFKLCRNVGINTMAFFIIGMPEDTERTLKETADLIEEIETTRLSISVAKPLPGTKLFEQCNRDNLFNGGFDADTLWTGEAEGNNKNKEDFFIKRIFKPSARQFWIKPYNISIDRLEEIDIELQKLAYKKSKAWVEHMRRNNA